MILLGLGSNIGQREENISKAISLLAKNNDIVIEKVSSLYETEPVGFKEQPAFLNAVISLKTQLPPLELLTVCLTVEQELGRVRDIRWGPRVIDVDMLAYDEVCMQSEVLILPHPRLHERKFVLVPLNEIASHLPLYNGMTVAELLRVTSDSSEVKLYQTNNTAK